MATRVRAPRRGTAWQDSLVNFDIASGAQSVSSLLGDWIPSDTRGATLVRTILCYSLYPSTPQQGAAEQVLDVGIGVTGQEAFGASVVPDPNTSGDEPQLGWIYRCRHLIHDVTVAPVPREINKDIRAMRKINDGELYLVINNGPVRGTAFNVRFIGIIRVLVKLA